MASKRTRNRLYWLAVKSMTLSERMTNGKPRETASVRAYKDALRGRPDSALLQYVDELEEVFGKHNVHKDLANEDLWFARQIVDNIRKHIEREVN